MSAQSRPRSTRDRPAKPPLSEDVVVETALRVLRAEGLDAVTMRRLAAELDTGPSSLYVYVAGRDELCAAMLDRVAGMVPLEAPDPTRWRAQLHALMHGLLTAMEAHPGIATVALANIPTGGNALLFAEAMLGVLRTGGIDDRSAAWACDVLPLIATATAIETVTYQSRGPEGEREEDAIARIRNAFSSLPPERFPHVTALAGPMTEGDGEERFAFAVDTFVDGLVARSARASGA